MFRRLAEPYTWNFIIENNDKDDIIENDKEDGDGVAAAAAASTTTAADITTTTALLHPPLPANKKRKLENGVSKSMCHQTTPPPIQIYPVHLDKKMDLTRRILQYERRCGLYWQS